MGVRGIWVVSLGVLGFACSEPEVEYRFAPDPIRFEIRACLENGGGCNAAMRDGAAGELEGCLVLKSDVGELGTAPVRWTGASVQMGEARFQVSRDAILEASLFVFDGGAESSGLADCMAGRMQPTAACSGDAGCILRLYQPPARLQAPDGGVGAAAITFGAPGACNVIWARGAVDESCDAADDDCDGRIDEAFPDVGGACPDGAPGRMVCRDDGAGTECDDDPPEEPEICDEQDNDLDGRVDEGFAEACCDPQAEPVPCNEDAMGDCRPGTRRCGANGQLGPCLDANGEPVGTSEPEVCNGVDDDCDSLTDEGFTTENGLPVGAMCFGAGMGICQDRGVVVCGEGARAVCNLTMPGADLPQPETCNLMDDDCDGRLDEEASAACWDRVPDANRQGACAPGVQRCVNGQLSDTCEGEVRPTPEVCGNDLDDDCDGMTDENLNACGACGDVPVEACNGQDDDCDGRSDEGFDLRTDPLNCGRCQFDCNRPPDGQAREGDFECRAGTCAFVGCPAGVVDVDGNPVNGCECTVGDEVVDFDDDDCDAVADASRNTAHIFVAPSVGGARDRNGSSFVGVDAAGRPGAPYNSLSEALAAVEDLRGAGVLQPLTIVLEVGEYALPGGLVVPDQVSILGGYRFERDGGDVDARGDPNDVLRHSWTRVRSDAGGAVTEFTGNRVLLRYQNLTGRTLLHNVVVRAGDAVVESDSSVAILATSVGNHLQIADCLLVGGQGADGPVGVDGNQGAALGNEAGGQQGTNSNQNPCRGCGGFGGEAPVCANGLMPINGVEVAAGGDGGDGGSDGGPGGLSFPDQEPAPGGRSGGQRGQTGEVGADGAPGRHGTNSAPGSADGLVPAAGLVPWVAGSSQAAGGNQPVLGTGTPGSGGGGGGGGYSEGGVGGGGGGGGAGGCPGTGGGGTSGGGGSFGLMVRGGTVRMHDVRIQGGNGGVGGEGGGGGRGSAGAPGGSAGSDAGCGNCTDGGEGGEGGPGGCGGNAGGGAGGPSVPVLRVQPAAGQLGDSRVRFVLDVDSQQDADEEAARARLVPGDGGEGGDGGSAGGSCGANADPGPEGLELKIGCCRIGAAGCTGNAGSPMGCPD